MKLKALALLLLLFPILMVYGQSTETVEIQAVSPGGEVYSNGVTTMNYSALWNNASSSFTASNIYDVSQGSYLHLGYSDYALTGDSTPLQWTPSTPGTHYTLVNSNDGDTSYVSTGTANYVDCWDFTNVAWTEIGRVRVYVSAKTTVTPTLIQFCLKIGGIVYPGVSKSLGTSYGTQFDTWDLSPASGTYFTASELNSAQVGVKFISGKPTSVARVSYAYVRVYPSVLSIGRSATYFNTASLTGLNLTSAYLALNCTLNNSAIDFNVTIQNGQPSRPSYPTLLKTDFYKGYYSGNGGSRNTTDLSLYDYFNITLNDLNWINQTGITKLFLRSSRDISGITPHTTTEQVIFASPVLVVTYETEGPTIQILFVGIVFLALLVGVPLFFVWEKDRRR